MNESPNEAPVDLEVNLEVAQAQLHESLESAKRLVQRTKFLLSGDVEAEANPSYWVS